MTLPPLPEPNVEVISGHREPFISYDSDQMREYGQQCREAALKDAAELCNGEQWRNEGKVSVAYIKAFNEGCVGCEGAVRGLLK